MSKVYFNQNKILMLVIFILSLTFAACSDESPNEPGGNDKPSGITMAFKTTGGNETEYILTKENIMSGEISAVGDGIEVTGWRFFYPVGKTLFASGYSEDNQCAAYVKNADGEIVIKGSFIFENSLEMFGHSDDNSTLLAMEIPRAGFSNKRLHFVDVNSGLVSKIVGMKIFQSQSDSLVAWPTALQVKGDKLFIPFHKLDALGY